MKTISHYIIHNQILVMISATKHIVSKTIQCLAIIIPILIPAVHIFILDKFWSDYTYSVNKEHCRCSCWDTVFKGPYEAGIARYKHMYFNATDNTFKMWALTVCCIIVLYECFKSIIKLFIDKQLRFKMTLLFILSLFSHYYSWWGFINYWNDDFYSQWNHQIFFTVTELYSTIILYKICDRKREIKKCYMLSVITIGLIHMIAAGFDQFVVNVIGGSGFAHQIIRDLFLMIPDVLNIVISILELQKKRKVMISYYGDETSSTKEIVFLVIIVISGLIIVSML
ncbi:uncharacterized protein LOC126894139 [Daktulosphaira vitifoliae]|uniref:uncharacterized protein LOC126894139 n=1 Tax=Daktulosphaira vitifoliae TaxID=58002 RepID=UPI0021AAFB16|nr:uncharacterized protein LOC126894139 [Daktulosphaira vitifoliae]